MSGRREWLPARALGAAFAAVAATSAVALGVQAASSDRGVPRAADRSSTPVAVIATSPSQSAAGTRSSAARPASDPSVRRSTAPRSSASRSTAPHSTAPHSTAPHSPAPHSTSPHSTSRAATSAAPSSDPAPLVFTKRTGDVTTTDCAATARYLVAQFLRSRPCSAVHRHLETTRVAGRTALVSVVRIDLHSAADVAAFVTLVSREGTGDVNPLRVAGLPAFVLHPSFLAAGGTLDTAWVFEAMWVDGTTRADDPTLARVLREATRAG